MNYIDPTGHFSINWAGGLMGLASTYIPGFGALMSITSLSSELFVGDSAKTKDGVQTPKPTANLSSTPTAGPAKEGATRTGDQPAPTPNPSSNNTQASTQPSNQKITLSSMAERIQKENKNATVKALDDNKLLITANTGFNDKVKIDFLGIELNGDSIVIEQIQYYDEKGVGCTNLHINVQDDLSTISVVPSTETVTTGSGKQIEVPAPEMSGSTNHTALDLNLTIKDDGTLIAKAGIGFQLDPQKIFTKAEITGAEKARKSYIDRGPKIVGHENMIFFSYEWNTKITKNSNATILATFMPMAADPLYGSPTGSFSGWDSSYIKVDFSKLLR